MSAPAPTVVVSSRGEQRVRAGHPWIYRGDVMEGAATVGGTGAVDGPRHRLLGHALFSDRSEMPIRMLTHGEAPADLAMWRRRIETAVRCRESLNIDATAYRVVHGEADLLPSLIVDRYAEYVVVQALAQGVDRLLPEITRLLLELLQPAGVLARNDPRVRTLEGLEQKVAALHGTIPASVVVREG